MIYVTRDAPLNTTQRCRFSFGLRAAFFAVTLAGTLMGGWMAKARYDQYLQDREWVDVGGEGSISGFPVPITCSFSEPAPRPA